MIDLVSFLNMIYSMKESLLLVVAQKLQLIWDLSPFGGRYALVVVSFTIFHLNK
jgi:hypothetical protein